MTIVLTNDDGVHAEGLRQLRMALDHAGLPNIVVAPERNHSGVSRTASYTNPVRVQQLDDNARTFAVAGTPVDCVRVAIGAAIVPDVSLVISGINHGCNTGDDMLNSGTVGAAVEAALFDVPAISISQQAVPGHFAINDPPDAPFTDFRQSAGVAVALARAVLARPPQQRAIVNVNVPVSDAAVPRNPKLCVTRPGKRFNQPRTIAPMAGWGSTDYYLVYGTHEDSTPSDFSDGTDFAALRDGLVGVTPVSYEHDPIRASELIDWARHVVREANTQQRRGGVRLITPSGRSGDEVVGDAAR